MRLPAGDEGAGLEGPGSRGWQDQPGARLAARASCLANHQQAHGGSGRRTERNLASGACNKFVNRLPATAPPQGSKRNRRHHRDALKKVVGYF